MYLYLSGTLKSETIEKPEEMTDMISWSTPDSTLNFPKRIRNAQEV